MTSKKFYTIYYAFLGLLMIGQAAYTIYQTSLVLTHRQQYTQLQRHQSVLAKKKQQLDAQLSGQLSLQVLADNQQLLTGYQPIADPLLVTTTSELAAIN